MNDELIYREFLSVFLTEALSKPTIKEIQDYVTDNILKVIGPNADRLEYKNRLLKFYEKKYSEGKGLGSGDNRQKFAIYKSLTQSKALAGRWKK
jgi:hypothetical protein